MQKSPKARGPKPQRRKLQGRKPQRTRAAARHAAQGMAYSADPALLVIYDTAPVGLACLTPDCRYLQINQRLTEICGISVADHIGRTVRETVPQVAEQVEQIVRSVIGSGEPIMGVEVNGQRADGSNADHVWITHWHPLRGADAEIVGVNVVAEDITERKRADALVAASRKAVHESETRFRELADNMSQFAWTADPSGRRYWYNRRWHEYTGTTPEEMQGWGWRKVHHPDHVDRVVERIRRSFETGEPWEDTFPLRGRDGRFRWFLSRALPIRNEKGEVVRWLGTNTDVTEQIEAEQALRHLNETLEQRVEAETRERLQIWNVTEDLLVVTDLEGRFLNINPAWSVALGWVEADLLGKSSQWLIHPDDQQKALVETDRLGAGRRTMRFEARFRHKDGQYRWLSWNAVADRGCIYAVGHDVTELREAENELREARRELTQTARRTTMGVMSAAIAHEIKQPLGAIVAHANAGLRWLNRATPDLEEARDSFARIGEAGHRASEVIQSVRQVFSGQESAETLLDPNDLIRDTMALVRADVEAGNIAIELGFAQPLPKVRGHRGQLQQVVLNLVNNAADAMRAVEGRARVLSVMTARGGAEDVAISIADSGAGIDPDNMQRIFDAFFTTKSGGMGMGLAICRSIVEAHGGALSVAPGVPHGAVFRIVLPCGR